MRFADVLQQLPPVSHLAGLLLTDETGRVLAAIENKPGKSGSVAVYSALAQRHSGRIHRQAAEEGLKLFAEHTQDALAFPGKHTNIDRLLQVLETDETFLVKPLEKLDPVVSDIGHTAADQLPMALKTA